MISRKLYLSLICTLPCAGTQQQVQNIEEQILEKGEKIVLWKQLRREIISSERFQKACQTQPPKSLQQFEKFFDEVRLFDELTKRYTLQIIQNNDIKLSLQDVLHNNLEEPLMLEELLNTMVGGEIIEQVDGEIEISDHETFKDMLTKKAIRHAEDMENIKDKLEEVQALIQTRDELINQQQVKIDQVENNVIDAKAQVKQAEEHIEKAEKYNRNARHIYYMLMALALFVLLLTLVFLRRKRRKR